MLFCDLYTVMRRDQYCTIVNHYDDVYYEGKLGDIPDFIWDWIFDSDVTAIVYDNTAPKVWIRVDCEVVYTKTFCISDIPDWSE